MSLNERLNQILPRITDGRFLSSEGIGNEIACYVFDYAARDELHVREHIQLMLGHLRNHHEQVQVLHLNLLDVVLDYLRQRGLFEKTLAMHAAKGDQAVLRALQGPLGADKIRDFIGEKYKPAEYDIFMLSGVGSVWPMLRAHNLLNCLHTITGTTPLLMFYPGSFDGTTLRLFGNIENSTNPNTKNYYRALILIPGGPT